MAGHSVLRAERRGRMRWPLKRTASEKDAEPGNEDAPDAGEDAQVAEEVDGVGEESADAEAVAAEAADVEDYEETESPSPNRWRLAWHRRSPTWYATAAGIVVILALGAVIGVLTWQADRTRDAERRHDMFVEAAKQSGISLWTIDYRNVNDDVKRIADSATGNFADDFKNRAPTFSQLVTQAQSKSEGSVVEAAVEAEDEQSAKVLLTMSVKNINPQGQSDEAKSIRMRITVNKTGADEAKMSNVEFVP